MFGSASWEHCGMFRLPLTDECRIGSYIMGFGSKLMSHVELFINFLFLAALSLCQENQLHREVNLCANTHTHTHTHTINAVEVPKNGSQRRCIKD